MNGFVLLLVVLLPLIGVLALCFVPKGNGRLIKGITLAAVLLPFLLSLYVSFRYRGGAPLEVFDASWKWFHFGNFAKVQSSLFSVNIELGLNGLSLLLLLLSTLLSCLAFFASLRWIQQGWKVYGILLLLLETGMIGVFVAGNLLLFFAFFEMTLVSLFFLVAKWGGEWKEKAAFRFLVYNGLGSLLLLAVFMVIFAKTGTDQIGALQQLLPYGGSTVTYMSEPLRYSLLIALLIALGVKLPIVPLHSWMIAVHREAPLPIVMLHSGVLLKIGAYGLIRFGIGFFPEQFKDAATIILALGLVNLLYGAFLALLQKDVRSVLAYSSVSHMGIVLIGLSVMDEAGIQGAVVQVVSHGLISALFFLLAGCLYERTATLQLDEMSGLAKEMPRLSGFLLAAGMASIGLPGTSGFIGEFLPFLALFHIQPVWGAVASLALVLTAVYILRLVMGITYGPVRFQLFRPKGDLQAGEWAPASVLVLLVIAIGIYPALLLEYAQPAITQITTGLGG
ncbi:complex I subunit 4 family protein [Bacillus testis]|uniref:complex I subunit 4 family protein n=1 Tax=Bacillus testis TaxID=1622072 RepID=UPI00067EC07A|nr:NADH-quinone oxidoreductase subunit M [Bacillus testis]